MKTILKDYTMINNSRDYPCVMHSHCRCYERHFFSGTLPGEFQVEYM